MFTLSSNLWKLTVWKGCRFFLVVMPIITIFYNSLGMNQQQIIWCQAIFSLSIVLFEIPTGYFSDRMSRKSTMIISSFLQVIGLGCYLLATDFYTMIPAQILMGIGVSFMSGTDDAMLYDTLLATGKKEKYKLWKGRMISVQNLSEATAAILGGFLVVYSIRHPLIVEFLCILPLIPISFSLIEPPRHKDVHHESALKNMIHIISFSIQKSKNIFWLMMYSGLLGASTLIMVWFTQPYFVSVKIPIVWFGIIFAGLKFSLVFFALFGEKYEKFFGKKYALINLLIMVTLGYIILGVSNSFWWAIFILLFYCVRSWQDPIIDEYIHEIVPSSMRATVLSIKGMFVRMGFVILGPLIGYFNDVYSLSLALIFTAVFFLISGTVCLSMLWRHKVL